MKKLSICFSVILLAGCISQPEPWEPTGGDVKPSDVDTLAVDSSEGDSGGGPDFGGECVPSCDGVVCGDNGCGGSCGDCNATEECIDGVCVFQPECDPYADWVCFPDGVPGEETGHVCTTEALYADSNTAGCSTYKDCPGGSIDDYVCLKPDLTGTIFGNLDHWPTAGGKCFRKCKDTQDCDILSSEKSLVCDNLFGKVTTKVCMVPGAFVEFDDDLAQACPE